MRDFSFQDMQNWPIKADQKCGTECGLPPGEFAKSRAIPGRTRLTMVTPTTPGDRPRSDGPHAGPWLSDSEVTCELSTNLNLILLNATRLVLALATH
jgi:hypothetical protein